MAVDERRRSELFQGLADAIGAERATTMFELMPPAGSDVATTADIAALDRRFDQLEQRMDDRLTAMSARFDERLAEMDARFDARLEAQGHELTATFRSELHAATGRQLRQMLVAAVSIAVTMTASAATLAQLG